MPTQHAPSIQSCVIASCRFICTVQNFPIGAIGQVWTVQMNLKSAIMALKADAALIASFASEHMQTQSILLSSHTAVRPAAARSLWQPHPHDRSHDAAPVTYDDHQSADRCAQLRRRQRSVCRSLRHAVDVTVAHAKVHPHVDVEALRSMTHRCAGDSRMTSVQMQSCTVQHCAVAAAECDDMSIGSARTGCQPMCLKARPPLIGIACRSAKRQAAGARARYRSLDTGGAGDFGTPPQPRHAVSKTSQPHHCMPDAPFRLPPDLQ
jgi:hypothetical protein